MQSHKHFNQPFWSPASFGKN